MPLRSDADECDLLRSGKGVACFPEPTPQLLRGKQYITIFLISGETLAGFPRALSVRKPPRKLGGGETPDEGFPTRKLSAGQIFAPLPAFRLRF